MTVKALFENNRNRIEVKINLGKNSFKCTKKDRPEIKINMNSDLKEYPLVVPYYLFEDFLLINDVDFKTVKIDENSISHFYGFKEYDKSKVKFSAELTKSFVNKWWLNDCPTIYRYSVNKDDHTNEYGLKLICFQDMLCEQSFMETYIGYSITEDEVNKLTKNYEHTHIYSQMILTLEAQKITDEQITSICDDVKNYESNIQTLIDSNKPNILNYIEDIKDNTIGNDFGTIQIFSKNQEITKKKSILKIIHMPKHNKELNITLPFPTAIRSIQRKQFEKIKEIIKDATGDELYMISI